MGSDNQIKAFAKSSFGVFIVLLAALLTAGLSYPRIVAALNWNEAGPKGPLWFAILPQVGVVLGASIGGWLWARTWIQKQEAIRVQAETAAVQAGAAKLQERSLDAAASQFEKNLESEREQFERKLLEDRFNRILDDLGSSEVATRIGASSRLSVIAKTQTSLTAADRANPESLFPLLRSGYTQLLGRALVDNNERVGRACCAGITDLFKWICQEMSHAMPNDVTTAERVEDLQIHLIQEASESNRSAYSRLKSVITSLSDRVCTRREDPKNFLNEELLPELETLTWSLSTRRRWIPQGSLRRIINQSYPLRPLYPRELKVEEIEALELDYMTASTQMLIARDILCGCLNALPKPVHIPLTSASPKEIRENGFIWQDGFRRAYIEGCFLPGSQFDTANLEGITFVNCDLRKAHFVSCNLSGGGFQDSILDNVYFQSLIAIGMQCGATRFREVHFNGAQLIALISTSCDFSKSRLSHVNLEGAILMNPNFREAKLYFESSLKDAEFRDPDFNGAFIACDVKQTIGFPKGKILKDGIFEQLPTEPQPH
jgi:hypothetical protein